MKKVEKRDFQKKKGCTAAGAVHPFVFNLAFNGRSSCSFFFWDFSGRFP